MSRLYRILAKKAIATASLLSIFFAPLSAWARVPNDPDVSDQAPFYAQIEAGVAWDYATGSRSVVVAIIDTGADTWHEDIAANVWKNPKEIADNNIDDDRNGFIDDMNGWNFVENSNDVRTSVLDSKDDADSVRHGTVIAGLIGAVGNNGRNGTGLNWQVSLMPIRAINNAGSGTYTNLVKSVQYAMDNGADVITMSFTGPHNNEALKSVLYQAYQRGIVVVAAAGNHKTGENGNMDVTAAYPACYDKMAAENWVLTVGSVDLDDVFSTFSNYGSCVDMVAPGEGIYSTERYAPQFGYHTAFGGEWRGTSFAAPLVAGAAALIKSYRPDWGADRIIPAIMNGLDSVELENPGQRGKMGLGRLNIGRVLAAIPATTPLVAPAFSNDALYRVTGNRVDRLDVRTSEQTRLTSFDDAKFIGLAPSPTNEKVSLLLRRDTFYFLRVVDSNGAFLSEVSLPIAYTATKQVKKVRWLAGEDKVVVEQYDTKRKITTFTVFTTAGVRTAQFEVAGMLYGWDTGKVGPVVSYAQAVGSVINVVDVHLDTSTKQRYTLKVKGLVDDFRYGPVLNGGEQAVVLVRLGKDTVKYTISATTQSFRKDTLGVFDAKDPWRLRLVSYPGGVYNTLVYKKSGSFAISDAQDVIVGTVKLPVDPAPIVY